MVTWRKCLTCGEFQRTDVPHSCPPTRSLTRQGQGQPSGRRPEAGSGNRRHGGTAPLPARRAAPDREPPDSSITPKAALTALRAQLDGLRRENSILQQECRKLRDGLTTATLERQKLLLGAEASRRQADDWLRAQEQLQAALAQAKRNLTLAEHARNVAIEDADDLRETASAARTTLAKCKQAYKDLRRVEDSLREEITQLKSQLAVANASVDPGRTQALSALLSTLRGEPTK